ncbi:hypothetical protein [Pseudofrankia sp. DC12]|uniref:hypothetical protein n=1 Tax=Pseudofrankia sp. DC12 TaxID=683315 RepID=UPI0005F878B6|nr:hypothetical protein [Pseudofrankia sp. DC12]
MAKSSVSDWLPAILADFAGTPVADFDVRLIDVDPAQPNEPVSRQQIRRPQQTRRTPMHERDELPMLRTGHVDRTLSTPTPIQQTAQKLRRSPKIFQNRTARTPPRPT